MKKWVVLVVIVAASAWGFQQWSTWRAGKAAASPARPTTAPVETRDIRFAVNAAGDIGPAEQVSVRPEVNGRILELPVDIGDRVKKGDLLFTLDDRDLQIERESQEKEIERARLQLEQASRNFDRARELFAEKLISQELFEQTRTEYELSRNSLERAQKSLDLVNDRLRKTRIVAPFDCTVLTRLISAGQAVSGSGGFNSGTEVLTIADLHEMVINAHINQADVTRLKSGQQVQVEVEAVPGLAVTGTVQRIAPQATLRNNIKGFGTRILLRDVDPRVRPGMTANIKIPVAEVDNVVAAPLAAVFTEPDPETGEIERFVYIQRGAKFERRPVRVGVSDFFFAEIQDGLRVGEVVSLIQPKPDEILDDAPPGGAGGPSTAAPVGRAAVR
jgi:HlyD family secretion protein